MYTQDVADFSSVIDESGCLEEDEIALRHVLEDFTAEEDSSDGIEVEGDNWTREAEDNRFSLYHSFRTLTSQRTLILVNGNCMRKHCSIVPILSSGFV